MQPLSMFIPLSKVDVEKRLVYGIATAEAADRSGEVCDYLTTKPHYEKWSSDLHAATNGLSKGNLRAMHGKVAAGKLTDITFNDDAKQIEICAKVVDDQEWKKVEEGVYTGFSQGGSYVKKWKDDAGAQRYTAMPSEISLVDLPCLKTATFDLIKGEGLAEKRHFAEAVTVAAPGNAEVAAKAAELAKAAGVEDFGGFVDQAREVLVKAALPAPIPLEVEPLEGEAVTKAADPSTTPRDGEEWEQVWKSKRDGKTFPTKAELRKYHEQLDATAIARAEAAPALDAIDGLAKTLTGDASPSTVRPRLAKAEGADALEKGLSQVSRLASIIQDLVWLQTSVQGEATREGDGSTMPDTIKSLATQLGAALVSMCGEEVGELFTAAPGASSYDMYMSAAGKVPEGHVGALAKFATEHPELAKDARETLEKLGARNSKSDAEKIQAMHDQSVQLGAACGAAAKAAATDDIQKRADALVVERDDALAKRDVAVAQHAALKEIVDAIPGRMDELRKAIESKPVETRLIGRAVSKSEEAGGSSEMSGEELEKQLKAMTPEERAVLLTKVAFQQPQRMGV